MYLCHSLRQEHGLHTSFLLSSMPAQCVDEKCMCACVWQERVVRLAVPPRRWKVPDFPLEKAFKRVIDVGERGVEQVTLDYYASKEGGGWDGVHGENAVWLELFGLLFADLILEIPGAEQRQRGEGLMAEEMMSSQKGVQERGQVGEFGVPEVEGASRPHKERIEESCDQGEAADCAEEAFLMEGLEKEHARVRSGSEGERAFIDMKNLFPTRYMDAPIDWETPLFYKSR